MILEIFQIVLWLGLAIANSNGFDRKSIVIWGATVVIIMAQINIIILRGG